MHLACVNQRMSLSEALAAATINAAHSIGRSKTHGSIERGKMADMIVLDAPRYDVTNTMTTSMIITTIAICVLELWIVKHIHCCHLFRCANENSW